VRITAKELEMSKSLVESFESDFTPGKFSDDYQAELRQLIDAKLEQGDALDTDETFGEDAEKGEKEDGEVLDLMEALRRSVESSRKTAAKAPAKATAKAPAKTASKAPARTPAKSTSKKKAG
jgi:DNA end-binding protein Ku